MNRMTECWGCLVVSTSTGRRRPPLTAIAVILAVTGLVALLGFAARQRQLKVTEKAAENSQPPDQAARLPSRLSSEPLTSSQAVPPGEERQPSGQPQPQRLQQEDADAQLRYADQRRRMVQYQLRGRDITDRQVLQVMAKVPRHRFAPEEYRELAYSDQALPIGHGQTISQPYIVALMTQHAQSGPQSKALDVGTGSGYQAAVLAELCKEVYSIEIVQPLAENARRRLAELGYRNVEIRYGDGYRGWPEHAPFDVIIVAAAPDHIPQPLLDQLAVGGRLVIPVGRYFQDLLVVQKQQDGAIRRKRVAPVAFVPMTGEAQDVKAGGR